MTNVHEKCAKKAEEPRGREEKLAGYLAFLPQLWVHDSSVWEPKVCPVRNNPRSLSKPRGGRWTSTYAPDYGSGWVRYCVAYRYNDPLDLTWTVLSVPNSARVALIDSHRALANWVNRYPRLVRGRRGLDFERLSVDYDAVHLTQEGYLRTRAVPVPPSSAGIANRPFGSGGCLGSGMMFNRISNTSIDSIGSPRSFEIIFVCFPGPLRRRPAYKESHCKNRKS
jgi:hypothetical protein